MAENEASGALELSVGGGVVPATAKLTFGIKRRWNSRGHEVLEEVASAVDGTRLEQRLLDSPEIEVLLARAISAAAASAVEDKRRLLARVVQAAVLDDAAIDQSTLIVDVLEQVDAVHLRCLEAIARAERESKDAGEWEFTAPGAEKPSNRRVQEVADSYPAPIIKRLEVLGLADASVTWDGGTRVTGMTVFGELLLSELRREPLPPT